MADGMTEFKVSWLDWDYKEHYTKAERVTDHWNNSLQLRARDRRRCRQILGRTRI